MKKITLTLGFMAFMGLGAIGFTIIYLRLDQIEEKLVYLEKLAEERPTPQNSTQPNGNSTTSQLEGKKMDAANELSTHNTYVTSGKVSSGFVPSAEPIFTGASVPEVVQLTQTSTVGNEGDLLLYFVDASTLTSPGAEQIGFARSTDQGKTWSEKTTITVLGKENAGPVVDPSLVQLSDGSVRMYFYGATKISDPATDTSQHLVYSAVSTDGTTFTVEDGVRFSAQKLTDPEVVEIDKDYWVMYYSLGQTTGIATSGDGLEWFDSKQSWSGGGVPGAYVDAAGLVHLYGCTLNGLVTASSTDATTFTEELEPVFASNIKNVCDPSPVLLEDDSVLFVYKQIN